MMIWLSIGMVMMVLAVTFILLRWGHWQLQGELPVSTPVFIAILFSSGLDVGLIMFPLTEFPVYTEITKHPEYAFSNPLAIEFGFWGGLVWAIYFMTCFYFCALEPKIGFFQIGWVRQLTNLIIIGTCAFTAHLLYVNLDWYLPLTAAPELTDFVYAAIVILAVAAAVFSSTSIRFVKILSVASGILFIGLACVLTIYSLTSENVSANDYLAATPLLGEYFSNIHRFVIPMNDYHAFYLFWWFAWSIMIGQFTARFVGNMSVRKLFVSMLFWPSLSIGIWFVVLYVVHQNQINMQGLINLLMVLVGIVFVINSLDSLIRLYSDNLRLTTERLGRGAYWRLHLTILLSLTALYSVDFLQIEWVGAVVIGLILGGMLFVFLKRKMIVSPRSTAS